MTDPWEPVEPRPWLSDGPPPLRTHVHRAYWTSEHTWCDPDCFECGGEGAPCCEPPDYPYAGVTYPPAITPLITSRERRVRTIYPQGDRL